MCKTMQLTGISMFIIIISALSLLVYRSSQGYKLVLVLRYKHAQHVHRLKSFAPVDRPVQGGARRRRGACGVVRALRG
jgi:hypothetical protein